MAPIPPLIPEDQVLESISSHCIRGSEDKSACIDRLMRAMGCGEGSGAALHLIASAAMGRDVHESDIIERTRYVKVARQTLRDLIESPGIPQRTPPWYLIRDTMITASDFGQAVGLGKFGTRRDFLEKKCGHVLPKPFDCSIPPLRWGIMFEPVACSLYSTLNTNVLVHEFGLLCHASKSFLGASPDGVTEDGVMLEIKCPWRRKIDGTVPMQYYLQIQGQLAVSGLLECDYFEVEFDILHSEEEIEAEFAEISRDESIMKSAFRGVFVEKIKHGSNEPPSYVYPPCFGRDNHIVGGGKSDSSPQSLLDHLREFVDAESSSLDDSYRVNIIWWKVRKHSTVKVHADTDFSARMIDTLEGVWNDVTCLRFDKDMYDQRMLDLAPVRRSASSSATVIKRGKRPPLGNKVVCSPELARGYAFLEDANDF
jgi:putative phage-type endonuclease